MKFKTLSINNKNDLFFGSAPNPVTTRRGLEIGGGLVYPELNFTLPPMKINQETLNSITNHYRQIVSEALKRARELHSQGVVFEFETLSEMTLNPEIGINLVSAMNDICEENYVKHGFKSEIRLTPNDLREFDRPPKMRNSDYLKNMFELFEGGAKAGGDLLSIESTGGKEMCDDALLYGNIKGVFFALTVLGVRDMQFLWKRIVDIANNTGKIAAGDTACGFGNTAMVLADKGMISKIFSSLVRIATIPRTLVAIEQGAIGPDKDCGYEGPFLKAITGIPISMEGKTAACAHLSPVGNVSAACCDLWSNESVQNIKLLAGMAPTVSLEQLQYDVRMFNSAIAEGKDTVLTLQRILVNSDIPWDPQALILAPDNVIKIAREIVGSDTYIEAAKRGALLALEIIEAAVREEKLYIEDREYKFMNRLRDEIMSIPEDETSFVEMMLPTVDEKKVDLSEYGL